MSTSSADGDFPSSLTIHKKKKKMSTRLSSLATTIKSSLPWTKLGLAFAVGYRWGTKNAAKRVATSEVVVTSVTRQFPWSAILLTAFGVKEIWFITPDWIKRNLPFYKNKLITAQASSSDAPDTNDLTSFASMSVKLQSMFDAANAKIEKTVNKNDETETKKSALSIRMTLFIALQVMGQYEEYLSKRRREIYLSDGGGVNFSSATDTAILKGLDHMFEFADWAYDELPEELGTLDEALGREGYKTLVRHDKPGIPGYVSHYVALNVEEKTVLISVKGTSGLEDFITDVCASSVNYTLPSSQTEVSCHEGILLSSQRLIADLEEIIQEWVVPTGYKVILTGHSLGAGVAALVGILLQDRFASKELNLKVWAFASPPVIDYDAALACQSYVTTIVNNFDIIPRCSLSNVAVLLEFLNYLEKAIEDSGQPLPKDFVSASQYVFNVIAKKEDTELDAEEIVKGMEQGFERVKLRDPDHLYVPGRVIHMSNDINASDSSSSMETTTATEVQVINGTSKALRSIELEASLLTDHLSPAYRSSIKSVLEQI